MKLAFLSYPYRCYTDSLYERNPSLGACSYAAQYQGFVEDAFHWIGAWETAFGALGHEVFGILANAKPLQRAWANENSLSWSELHWQVQVATAQLRKFKPDVLLLYEASGFDASWLDQIRVDCPSLRMVLGFSASPSGDPATLRRCDIALSSCPPVIKKFERAGCRTHYFPHAFNPNIVDRLPSRNPIREQVLFSGSIVRADGYHFKREKVLEALVAQVAIVLHCPEEEYSFIRDLIRTTGRRGIYALMKSLELLGVDLEKRRRIPIIGPAAKWTNLPQSQISPHLSRFMRPPVYGMEMMNLLRSAAVALNDHGEICEGYTSNMRMFEATGVGSCLLTDATRDLATFFEPDREVVAYNSPEECVEKARWLLAHPKEREGIALAGQKRTLREHCYNHRAANLNELVHNFFKGASV